MLVALDVAYTADQGHTVALAFANWPAATATAVYTATVTPVAAYAPGAFYARELPCLLAVIAQVELASTSCLIIDGYVTLGNDARPGLGHHLYAALGGHIPVVGVAKTRFQGVAPQVVPMRRGQSQNPLYVTSVGLPLAEAVAGVAAMHGPHRMPMLLKELDRLTRQG